MTGTNDHLMMDEYCTVLLRDLLGQCDVEAAEITAIVADVRQRAVAFAALDEEAQRTITAPFFEDVAHYKPHEAPTFVKAAVAVTVRNSRLELVHADGIVRSSAIEVITQLAAQPLALLMVSEASTSAAPSGGVFSDLDSNYPRAWAAMRVLADGFRTASGGRIASHSVRAPMPEFPSESEVEARPMSSSRSDVVIENALVETFNEYLIAQLRQVIDSESVFFVPSLSRISRNCAKLLRVVELLLAHHVPILTTNYLIRSSDVWIRQGELISPNIDGIPGSLRDESGLAGAHRKIARSVRTSLEQLDK